MRAQQCSTQGTLLRSYGCLLLYGSHVPSALAGNPRSAPTVLLSIRTGWPCFHFGSQTTRRNNTSQIVHADTASLAFPSPFMPLRSLTRIDFVCLDLFPPKQLVFPEIDGSCLLFSWQLRPNGTQAEH